MPIWALTELPWRCLAASSGSRSPPGYVRQALAPGIIPRINLFVSLGVLRLPCH
jgi:hypothetical protein